MIYLGHWRWKIENEESFWSPPLGTTASIDLRNPAQCAQTVTPSGFGLFDIPGTPEPDLELLGADMEDTPSDAIKTCIENLLGLPRAASWNRCGDIVWELLTLRRAALTGTGLMPTSKRKLELHLDKWSRSIDFGVSVEEWAGVQADLRSQYRAHKQNKNLPKDHYRRILSAWCAKYGTQDWKLFVPGDLPFEEPLPHSTTITEAFSGTLAAWTTTVGSPTISGGKLFSGTVTNVGAFHNTPLSTDDMYTQAKVDAPAVNTGTQRVLTRQNNALATASGYMALIRQNGANQDIERWKIVGGGFTQLTPETSAIAWTNGTVLRIESDGSNHRVLVGGVEQLANVSDVTITGTLTAGVHQGVASNGGFWDDFEAGDLGEEPPEIPSDVIPRRAIKSWHYR